MKSDFMESLPEGAIPLTSDGLLRKLINKEGDRRNNSASYKDTAVAVNFVLRSSDGIIDSTENRDPVVWIIGDSEMEMNLPAYLTTGVRTMREGEESTFYFDRRYFLGNAPLIRNDGKMDKSQYFTANVQLLKATPLDQINTDEPPTPPEPTPTPATEKPPKPKKKGNEPNPEKDRKCILFALMELQKAEELLEKKPAAARKEFNKARTAWGPTVDTSKAPEVDHPILNGSVEDAQKYINSRALYGVARTFLVIHPPQKDKAIMHLQEARDNDPTFEDVTALLVELGVDLTEAFPSFDDIRLTRNTFWMDEKIDWQKRLEYSEYAKQRGSECFHNHNYDAAIDWYNRAQIAFTNQRLASLPPEKRCAVVEVQAVNKLNIIGCMLEQKRFADVFNNGQRLINFLDSYEQSSDSYKAKCYYRMCRALITVNRLEDVEIIVAKMKQIKGTASVLADIRKRVEEQKKVNQHDQDFMYKKMTGTL